MTMKRQHKSKMTNLNEKKDKQMTTYLFYIFHCLQAQYFPNGECMAQDNPAK
jgi:hypothetical protein